MAALTKDRNTPERSGEDFAYPAAGGVQIFAGALVVLEEGFARPAAEGEGLVVVGRADARVDNRLGADGELQARVRLGVFRFANSDGADRILPADVGSDAWILDDQTVGKDEAGRSKAGRVMDVDAQGVWVKVG
ncbi:hypothetical protein [Neomegalonema sp.]|uniref:hypothetical protein n=1 Tax=Neomegalonema sp. TaxID=2039713 RepID=UPI00261C477F|nr:hypothetical protein [Neomegalonema sp.]MDD2870092.1 hypothetical protein [Neomegalonema sp.]